LYDCQIKPLSAQWTLLRYNQNYSDGRACLRPKAVQPFGLFNSEMLGIMKKTARIRAGELYKMVHGVDKLATLERNNYLEFRGWIALGKAVLATEMKWAKTKESKAQAVCNQCGGPCTVGFRTCRSCFLDSQ